ncbi:DNA utilization protein HofM [Lelliottia sp. CFBP8978]|uniref:DNA utilization protein HofM n=1 Tax=Lelliottia sp. CFBP8978 TaxID=3096522 RepID=UPI002A6B89D3|nr:DNA utilization protein HofM [Lelliottia sp. CFBP8978]MDY1038070.1 DNA utilization protein HofM [Lelliottia sp. CFBP8978]
MAFKTWRTGVHIQQDRVIAVALTKERSAWYLRRWWQIPLLPDAIRDGQIVNPEQVVSALSEWSRALPRYHRIFLAFPAARTLQKALPRPGMRLNDSEQASWIASAMSRELEMAPDALCFDYVEDTLTQAFHVTAAQNKEVADLLMLAKTLRLNLTAITPDAGALTNLLPLLAAPVQCVAWCDSNQWLWAMRHQWGRKRHDEAENVADLAALLALNPQEIVLFDARQHDPFSLISRYQPPLPENGADFTVALALAMGEILE